MGLLLQQTLQKGTTGKYKNDHTLGMSHLTSEKQSNVQTEKRVEEKSPFACSIKYNRYFARRAVTLRF